MSEILDFSKFPLDSHIQAAIAEMGYVTPTPIQVQAIPVVLAGQDVICLLYTSDAADEL